MRKCTMCGNELTTGDMDSICNQCKNAGFTFNIPFPPTLPPSFPPRDYPIPSQTGWMCPRCGAVHAPFVQRCDCFPPTITTSGTKIES